MQPFDCGILSKLKVRARQSQIAHRFSPAVTIGPWFYRISHRWSIHKKIGCGYILAISLAILGTGAGLIVGEYYDDKAVEKFRTLRERYGLIEDLEKTAIEVNYYQQRIIFVPENTTQQYNDVKKLLEKIGEARTLIAELEDNLKTTENISPEEIVTLKSFLQTYDNELKSYTSSIELFSQKIQSANLSPNEIQAAKQVLGMTDAGKLEPTFERLSESFAKLVESNAEQREQALATFRASKYLRVTIILASMALSMTIAAILAFYTSRAIARPIKAVTDVAQRATQEGNFNLQAPVTTEDEIAVLATSLNQLIERVATQIHQLKQAQTQLIQSEKMSSLGQMVAGVAHEINNPINFIYGNIEYAKTYTQELLELVELYQQYYPHPLPQVQKKIEDIELDFLIEDLPKILQSMKVGTERIRELILSLRNFCRLDEAERKQVDIHQGIDNTLLLLSHRLTSGIQVIKQYDSLPMIECYPAQLNQVFLNILDNALDELQPLNRTFPSQIFIRTRLTNARVIEVRIRDNGLGIAPEIKDKIFDPFFTTKPVGKGTGMGLAIAYQIVEKHRGKIEVFSELGRGAEFVITLPIKPDFVKRFASH